MKTITFISNTSWSMYNFRLGVLKALKKEGYKIVIIVLYDVWSEKLKKLEFDFYDISIERKGTDPIKDLMTLW